MSADPIVYCLEQLTDYSQFERFCSDLMAESGYPDIEPIGGSNDGGRDALHVTRADPNSITIFAYSVRDDWQQKLLNEDCRRIRDEGHSLSQLVFVCTSTPSATERDRVRKKVADDFGWDLELYGLERIRVLLTGRLRHLIASHPAIFCPPFFPTGGGLSLVAARDTVVIDHVPADHALATWLGRRLQLAGYKTWCYGTAPLAGQDADDSVRRLIELRAYRYLPVLSTASMLDADFLGRCGIASGHENLTIPCRAEHVDAQRLPGKLKRIAQVRFEESWADGLRSVLASLASAGAPSSSRPDHDRGIVLRSYVPEPVTRDTPEKVYTNTFPVKVPAALLECRLRRTLTKEELDTLRASWAFVEASTTTFLAFDAPPATLPLQRGRIPEYAWSAYESRHGKSSVHVVKELVWRSLDVACRRVGMRWCDDRRVFCFHNDTKPLLNFPFTHVDGRATRVALAGQKTYGSGERAQPFRYQLCPKFRVGFDDDGACWVTLRLYVRVTDLRGVPFEKKAIIRRRKTVTKSWWNKEWFARTLGMMQALSGGATEITVGAGKRAVVVSCEPMTWQCPVSIDYDAVDRLGNFQQEMAEVRYRFESQNGEEGMGNEEGDDG